MNKYERQQNANITAFLHGEEFLNRRNVLSAVCKAFERTNITWGLAMSSSLFFRGLIDDYGDYDILIEMDDVKRFETIFKRIGGKIDDNTKQKPVFSSPYYKEGYLYGFHFDLISNFTVNTFGKTYKYVLKKSDIHFVSMDGDLHIPLLPIEANYLLYAMLVAWQSRRIYKENRCMEYLDDIGLEYRDVFERINNIEDSLPSHIVQQVQYFLTKNSLG